jgi:hypothetical protein
MSTRKKSQKVTDSDVAFKLHEALRSTLKDLWRIRQLIPLESSRYVSLIKDDNARAIADARKNDLLSYIMTVCDDNLHWGGAEIMQGWTAEQREHGFSQGNGKRSKPKGSFKPEDWLIG